MKKLNIFHLVQFILFYFISGCQCQLDPIAGDPIAPAIGNIPKLNSNGIQKVNNHLSQIDKNTNPGKLSEEPQCKNEIEKMCKNVKTKDNLNILNCIQSQEREDSEFLTPECHHVVWLYKNNITQSKYVISSLKTFCKHEQDVLQKCSLQESSGYFVSCFIQHLDEINKMQCKHFTLRLASIVFSDYRLVQPVVETCSNDIEQLKCGRIQTFNTKALHSQGFTLECLTQHIKELGSACKLQVFRLSELQSEDFHLDRALFFACRDDRETFCSKIRAGKGKVFQCLMNHQKDRTMSLACSKQLDRRENLIARDYKVSRFLVNDCKATIKEFACRKGTKDDDNDTKLSKILVCLEDAIRNNRVQDGLCKQSILAHRQLLLKMSPKTIDGCEAEIKESCSDVDGDKRIHCLMNLYKKAQRRKAKMSSECKRSLEDVMKETDVAEDWRVDPVLHEACSPVVQTLCKGVRDGKGRIIRCLMKGLARPEMTPSCKTNLMEIMYFVSRDWKLDPQIYEVCKPDAEKLCHAEPNWIKTNASGPENSILVLPCLFRYAYRPTSDNPDSPNNKLTRLCSAEIRRVMYERSSSVALHPQIELECIDSLGMFCSEDIGPGKEMLCLQKNLANLNGACHSLITNYTSAEVKDVGLNSIVKTQCANVIAKKCDNLPATEGNDGGIMDCLINVKNHPDMTEQCRTVVESFQLVMMEDVQLNEPFRKYCRSSVMKYCQSLVGKKEMMRERISCLSEILVKDVIAIDDSNAAPMIPPMCKVAMRSLLKQRHESANVDTDLKLACADEIEDSCNMKAGRGKILECLRRLKLSASCKEVVFKRKREESVDPLTDVTLVRDCRRMIQTYCKNSQPSQLFQCLKAEKDNPEFDVLCRSVLGKRMEERSKDVRLNPFLYKACRMDMNKFCKEELNSDGVGEKNGKIIECLKKQLPAKKLTSRCELRVLRLTKNAALNFKLDPVLLEKCDVDLKQICLEQQQNQAERGEVEECLKSEMEKNKLTKSCAIHISDIVSIEKVDIHADPILFKVCAVDDNKFCSDRARGTHITCLYDILNRHPDTLTRYCKQKLTERRELFKSALQFSNPESLQELVESVRGSPKRNYLLIVLMSVVGVVLVVGISCGRFSRRTRALIKNR